MATDNVSVFPTDLPIQADVILEKAKEWGLEEALIVGVDKNGDIVVGGTHATLKDASWMIRLADTWLEEQLRRQ